MMPIFSL